MIRESRPHTARVDTHTRPNLPQEFRAHRQATHTPNAQHQRRRIAVRWMPLSACIVGGGGVLNKRRALATKQGNIMLDNCPHDSVIDG